MDDTLQTLANHDIKEHPNIKQNKRSNKTKYQFFKYCRKCSSSHEKKKKNCFSNCSIMNQFLIMFVPIAYSISTILIILHIYLFNNILKIDYYKLIKEEYLKYVVTDVEDKFFDLRADVINNKFKDISNFLFFKLYLDELISFGLLDGDKIFPNVSNITGTFFSFLDIVFENDKANTNFSIPGNLSKKFIDERNDSLSELAKVYYYFYPLLSFEAFSLENYINQTYLLAYQLNDNNNDIFGEPFYMNFPRPNDDFLGNINNFAPFNDLISPKVNKSKSVHSELLNNTFYNENWFTFQDYNFRESLKLIDFSFHHLNINHDGKINKSSIATMQALVKNNLGKRYIINIIFFIGEQNPIIEYLDQSVFIVKNSTSEFLFVKEKYSDNKTFTISQNDISEVLLSSVFTQYFHYSLLSKDSNFYDKGLFFDHIDLNYFAEPNKYYTTIKGFEYDIRYFSSLNLYTKLFQMSSYVTNYSDEKHIYIYTFNEKWHINDVCSRFDFKVYINFLKGNKINCWDEKNSNLYSYSGSYSRSEGINIPYCICLPLYCLKNNNKNIDLNNIEFVDSISLPEKCETSLKFYENQISEENLNKADGDKLSINNLLKFRQELGGQLEDEFIKFRFSGYDLIKGLSFILISIVDNTSYKIILYSLINYVTMMEVFFIIIISIGIILLYAFAYILILINLKRLSNGVYKFKEKSINFINKLWDKKDFLSNTSYEENNNKLVIDNQNNLDNITSFKNEITKYNLMSKLNYSINIQENKLIDDLFKIFCNYYNMSENKAINISIGQKHGNETRMKIRTLYDKNELFKLFCIITLYIPKLVFKINTDYNLFFNSKLVKNFIKSLSKSSFNIDEEQIIYTKSIIYELLSSELINDSGFVTNLNFNYLTNINLNSKGKNSAIQKGIFKQALNLKKKELRLISDKKDEYVMKFVWKHKNLVMDNIEIKFEQDDYLQLKKLESYFNNYLLNGYYNYLKKFEKEFS